MKTQDTPAGSAVDAMTTPNGELLEAAWQALAEDCGVWVYVVDRGGFVVFMSDGAVRAFGTTREGAAGQPIQSVLPEAVGMEQATFIARSIRENRRMCIDGIVRGAHRRCVVRPIAGDGGGAIAALCTSRVLGETPDDRCDEVVRARHDDRGEIASLTDREVEVLSLIGRGLTTAQIAKHLHRSVKTIEWHRVALGNKLGASNRVELARLAIRLGLTGGVDPTVDDAPVAGSAAK